MARYFGAVQGQAGQATRIGSPRSGIVVNANGWDVGVRVIGSPLTERARDDVSDQFDIYATSGSNATHASIYLGRVLLDASGRPTFEPRKVQ